MIFLDVFLSILLLFVGTALWQHFRYLKMTAGRSALEELRALREVIERPAGGSVVYVGLVGPARGPLRAQRYFCP